MRFQSGGDDRMIDGITSLLDVAGFSNRAVRIDSLLGDSCRQLRTLIVL